ncbi:hypothetical protein BC332_18221 [Capsicum chinense]|nr:hypothetical protein BC332_18221 [Capsicum chinense]
MVNVKTVLLKFLQAGMKVTLVIETDGKLSQHYMKLHPQEHQHCFINIRNILIDSNIRAKIGNFNLAKETDTSGTTWELVGTTGYMAPEYVEAGSVTSKMDIYAFGVVLLELVTKKDVVIVEESGEILLSAAVAENNGWIHRSTHEGR